MLPLECACRFRDVLIDCLLLAAADGAGRPSPRAGSWRGRRGCGGCRFPSGAPCAQAGLTTCLWGVRVSGVGFYQFAFPHACRARRRDWRPVLCTFPLGIGVRADGWSAAYKSAAHLCTGRCRYKHMQGLAGPGAGRECMCFVWQWLEVAAWLVVAGMHGTFETGSGYENCVAASICMVCMCNTWAAIWGRGASLTLFWHCHVQPASQLLSLSSRQSSKHGLVLLACSWKTGGPEHSKGPGCAAGRPAELARHACKLVFSALYTRSFV